MNAEQRQTKEALKLQKSLEEISAQFLSEWSSGGGRSIEEFVKERDGNPSEGLIIKLIELEIDHRLREGDTPSLAEYTKRFPGLPLEQLETRFNATDDCETLPRVSDPYGTLPPKQQTPEVSEFDQSTLARTVKPEVSTDKHEGFGDYEIIGEIARGGMGVVYKARQSSLNRTVALKMILSGRFAGEEEINRFKSEAEAAANLDHPGIVPIYEIGEHEGNPYFSMGFVEGENLAKKTSDGPLEPRAAAGIVKRIASAISFAHERGVIHRDLKPANVLMDHQDQPKITDFGLAKQLQDDSNLTGTGQILGTPSYMPPEQASGDASQADERSDVYAVGAILYFLLVDRPPFRAATPMDTVSQVLNKDAVALRTLDNKIPKDLETICFKCLRKDPSKRYETAKQLADDLERWLDNKPIVARRVGFLEKTKLWCKRKPALVASIAISLVLIIGVTAFLVRARQQAEANRLVQGLLQADTTRVAAIIEDLVPFRGWARNTLRSTYADSEEGTNAKLHSGMALFPEDQSVLPYLQEQLLTVDADQFAAVLSSIKTEREYLIQYFGSMAQDENQAMKSRFRAACVVAQLDVENKIWSDSEICRRDTDYLVTVPLGQLSVWREMLEPVKSSLTPHLESIFRDSQADDVARSFACEILIEYFRNQPDNLVDLLADAEPRFFESLFEAVARYPERAAELAKRELGNRSLYSLQKSRRRANAAIALIRLGQAESAWFVLAEGADYQTRSYLVNQMGMLGCDLDLVIAKYKSNSDAVSRGDLVMAIGNFIVPVSKRESLSVKLLEDYQNDPDPGLHGAIEWLLNRWGKEDLLVPIDAKLRETDREKAKSGAGFEKNWYVGAEGHAFSIFDAGEFQMGTKDNELGRVSNEFLHRRRINRRVAMATKEVSYRQWQAFVKENPDVFNLGEKQRKLNVKSDDSPMIGIEWFEAARYCNWLSDKEGIPEDQWCYEKNEDGKYQPGMKAKPKFWELKGYRLPTDAEWEFACRAGSTTTYYFGSDDSLLGEYAWYEKNSVYQSRPGIQLMPNSLGLFNMLGNVEEWCYDANYKMPEKWFKYIEDFPTTDPVTKSENRIVRGGSFGTIAVLTRCGRRNLYPAASRTNDTGFRVARTISKTE